jgi:fatty acid desaturase
MLIDEPSPSITTPPASQATAVLSVPMVRSDAAAFARLTLELREAGLLEPRSRRYVVSILGYAALMVAAWTAFALTGSFWLAPVIGLLYARMGYHLHDLSHFHAFHSRRWNDHAAHFVGFFVFGSIGRFRRDHEAHHKHTNDLVLDPDIQAPLAMTAEQARKARGLNRLFARFQHLLLLPVLSLVAMWTIRGLDVAFLARARGYQHRRREALILSAHVVCYMALVFGTLSPAMGLLFVFVQQTVFSTYFTLAFTVNHLGMPVDGRGQHRFRRLAEHTRNVTPGFLSDWFYGPLAAHIEHHLYPRMSRYNLRAASKLVKPACREQGIAYVECGVLEAYRDLHVALREAGKPAREPLPGALARAAESLPSSAAFATQS